MSGNFLNFFKTFSRLSSNCWRVTGLGLAAPKVQPQSTVVGCFFNAPAFYVFTTVLSAVLSILGSKYWSLTGMAGLVVWPALAIMHFELSGATWAQWRGQLRGAVGNRKW